MTTVVPTIPWRFRPGPHDLGDAETAVAWLPAGTTPAEWAREVAGWRASAADIEWLPLPRSATDRSVGGMLAIPPVGGGPPTPTPGALPYVCRAGVLYLPVGTVLEPPLTDDEIRERLPCARAVYRPGLGLVGFGTGPGGPELAFAAPRLTTATWDRAEPGSAGPSRLRRIVVRAPDDPLESSPESAPPPRPDPGPLPWETPFADAADRDAPFVPGRGAVSFTRTEPVEPPSLFPSPPRTVPLSPADRGERVVWAGIVAVLVVWCCLVWASLAGAWLGTALAVVAGMVVTGLVARGYDRAVRPRATDPAPRLPTLPPQPSPAAALVHGVLFLPFQGTIAVPWGLVRRLGGRPVTVAPPPPTAAERLLYGPFRGFVFPPPPSPAPVRRPPPADSNASFRRGAFREPPPRSSGEFLAWFGVALGIMLWLILIRAVRERNWGEMLGWLLFGAAAVFLVLVVGTLIAGRPIGMNADEPAPSATTGPGRSARLALLIVYGPILAIAATVGRLLLAVVLGGCGLLSALGAGILSLTGAGNAPTPSRTAGSVAGTAPAAPASGDGGGGRWMRWWSWFGFGPGTVRPVGSSFRPFGSAAGDGLRPPEVRPAESTWAKWRMHAAASLAEKWLEFFRRDPDRALKYAIPLGDEPGAGGGAGTASHFLRGFDARDTDFRLDRLFAPGGGGSSVLLPDWLLRQVRERYVAEAARLVKEERWRKAAYVYGELLRDYPNAASSLERGGFHREAAELWLRKLNRPLDAARCLRNGKFLREAAEIYEAERRWSDAARTYREAGDAAAALRCRREEVRDALDRHDFALAGRVLRDELHDPQAAREAFRLGWERPAPDEACLDGWLRLSAPPLVELPAGLRPLEDFVAGIGSAGPALKLLQMLRRSSQGGAVPADLLLPTVLRTASRFLAAARVDGDGPAWVEVLAHFNGPDPLLSRDGLKYLARPREGTNR